MIFPSPFGYYLSASLYLGINEPVIVPLKRNDLHKNQHAV